MSRRACAFLALVLAATAAGAQNAEETDAADVAPSGAETTGAGDATTPSRFTTEGRTIPLREAVPGMRGTGLPPGISSYAPVGEPGAHHESEIFGIDEIRFGAFGQVDAAPGQSEGGAYAQFEALFSKPSWVFDNPILDLFFRPRPNLGLSINTAGDTSQAFAGLNWDVWVSDRFFLEGAFGLALHDGELSAPTDGQPAMGCRVLPRGAASAGMALSPNWRVTATLSRTASGGLCDPDDGLTQAGVSFGFSF